MQEQIDKLLKAAVASGDLTAVSCGVTGPDGLLYHGSFAAAGQPAVHEETVFAIYSMTKAITAAAAMQLVEQGRLELDEPAGEVCPELANLEVLEGYDEQGVPRLRPPHEPITLRHLLTHTSGLVYEIWNEQLNEYLQLTGTPSIGSQQKAALNIPLMFDPGERWEYGISIDWVGQMIEAVSGVSLGEYLREHLTGPLKMTDTVFTPPASMQTRTLPMMLRQADGSLIESPSAAIPATHAPEFELGGGGLNSTVRDYCRFMQMLLRGGELDGVRVLKGSTVELMATNQMGDLRVTPLRSVHDVLSNDVDLYPGIEKSWGISFLINEAPGPAGRPAGSLMWAGLGNLYFWIDLQSQVAAVFMTQMLPFGDHTCLALVDEIEKVVYASH